MKQQLQSLQVLRGFAAISVVFYHTHLILMQYGKVDLFGSIAIHGKAGVNIFFVLSGFIILKAHSAEIGQKSSVARYLFRRFVRLYPIYWILTLAFMGAAAAGLGDPDFSWQLVNLISAFALYEFYEPLSLPLKVAWTLVHEVRFYLVFALLLISRSLGICAFAVWTAATLFATAVYQTDDLGWLSPWMLYFVSGMIVYLISQRFNEVNMMFISAAAIAFLVAYIFIPNFHVGYADKDVLPSLLWLIPTCSLLLLVILYLEEQWCTVKTGLWTALGDASYSIYLVHSAVISVCAIIARKLGLYDWMGAYPLFAATFLSSVLAGVLVHKLLEAPMLSRLRSFQPESGGKAARQV